MCFGICNGCAQYDTFKRKWQVTHTQRGKTIQIVLFVFSWLKLHLGCDFVSGLRGLSKFDHLQT